MSRKLSRSLNNEESLLSDNQAKIEIVHCPRQQQECVSQLPLINRYFNESQLLRLNKDYHQSIGVLERAFECTWEISDEPCRSCACLFRQLIISTLEAIRDELRELTSGWFGVHDYLGCLEQATQSLQAFRLRM